MGPALRPSGLRALFRLALPALLALAAIRVDADAAPCAPAPAPDVEVRIDEPPAAYRLAEPSAALAAEAAQSGTALGRGSRLLGFTTNHYAAEIHIATASGAAGCASLRSVVVVIGARPEVLVDGRYAAQPCQQDAILAHENAHVAVFREAAAAYVPAIGAALRRTLPAALEAATEAEARAAYARMVRAALEPWLDAVRQRAQDGNARLDTVETYGRVFRLCPSW